MPAGSVQVRLAGQSPAEPGQQDRHRGQAADGRDAVGATTGRREHEGLGQRRAGCVQHVERHPVAGLRRGHDVRRERRRGRGDPVAGREGAGQECEVAVPGLGRGEQRGCRTAVARSEDVAQGEPADPGAAAVVAEPVAEAVHPRQPVHAEAETDGPRADGHHRARATREGAGVRGDGIGGEHQLTHGEARQQRRTEVRRRLVARGPDGDHVERGVGREPGLTSYDVQAGRDRGAGRIGTAGVRQPPCAGDLGGADGLAVVDNADAAGGLAEVDAGDQA